MFLLNKPVHSILAALAFALVSGCGGAEHPPLGAVTGKVTKEGKPVKNIILFFKPDSGRAATATTDKDGFYRLEYVKGVAGTKLGPTTVLLEWPLGYQDKDVFAIPSKYAGATSEQKLEVKKGSNTFNIDIIPDTAATKQKVKPVVPVE